VRLVVAWGIGIGALPHLADAEPGPSSLDEPGAAALETASAALEEELIRARLQALGASPADTEAVLQRLTPEERTEMARRAQELSAGGNGAAVLAIAIIVGLVVIFALELLGRRVISRPSP
jgi:hypothetical protein